MSKLNQSHRLALNYLENKRPGFVSAEEIGREVGDQIGMEGWGSAFGLPLCTKLVEVGLAVQNEAGHYAASKPAKTMRYAFSVARHYLTGKLTIGHAVYALRERPVAVSSKGKTWVIEE